MSDGTTGGAGLTTCTRCGKPMWAGPPGEPQRDCALCQLADERGAGAPPVHVRGYVPQTPEDEAAFGEIVAAAVRRMERES